MIEPDKDDEGRNRGRYYIPGQVLKRGGKGCLKLRLPGAEEGKKPSKQTAAQVPGYAIIPDTASQKPGSRTSAKALSP
jgi:hypothetical protein